MIRHKAIAVLTVLVLVSYSGFCQIGGLRAFSFLEIPNHARVAGLGTVNISVNAEDVNMVWQNPALLNTAMDQQLSFSVNPYFAGIYNTQFTYATNHDKLGMFSLGINYLHHGEFQGFDNTGASTSDFTAADYVIQLSHSRQEGVFNYGANLKFAGSQISGFQQSAVLVDFGGAFVHPEKELTAALVIKNLGFFTSRFSQEDRRLPFDIQLGSTLKPEFMPFRFSLTLNRLYQYDLSYFDSSLIDDDDSNIFSDINNSAPTTFDKLFQHVTIGTEVLLGKSVNLRAGYNHLLRQALRTEQVGGAGGFTFGIYVKTKKFNLAYSNAVYQSGGFAHFITLGSDLKEFIKKKKS